MKDCIIEKTGDKLVRITSKSSKFKVNTREERIGRYVEGYKKDSKPKDDKNSDLEELRKEAKNLGINGMHNAKKETLIAKIEEKKLELEIEAEKEAELENN